MMMQRTSRATALISGFFLAAMVLATSGFACATDSSGGDMASMRMSGSVAGAKGATTLDSAPVTNPESQQAPCKFPWAPDGCQSMVSCSAAAVTTPLISWATARVTRQTVAVAVALKPPSEMHAPELPPPRA